MNINIYGTQTTTGESAFDEEYTWDHSRPAPVRQAYLVHDQDGLDRFDLAADKDPPANPLRAPVRIKAPSLVWSG